MDSVARALEYVTYTVQFQLSLAIGYPAFYILTAEMLTPAYTDMSIRQWQTMPRDTNGVESLNKCSIDHSHRSKSLRACVEYAYRQDKKASLEHLYAYRGLPISFRRKSRHNEALRSQTKQGAIQEAPAL